MWFDVRTAAQLLHNALSCHRIVIEGVGYIRDIMPISTLAANYYLNAPSSYTNSDDTP